MAITIPALEWRTMTPAINQIKRAPAMLQDMIFTQRNTNASEYVDVDITVGGTKILPFVQVTGAGTVIEGLTQKMGSVLTPRLRPKKPFNAPELLNQRGPGKVFYANGGTVVSTKNQKIGLELADLRTRVDTTIEWMCAQALSGGFTVTDDGHKFVIDYGMPADHKPTLTSGDGWNESTGDPIGDIDTWSKLIRNATGYAPTMAICGANVVSAIRGNEAIMKQLDNRRVEAGGLIWDTNSDYIGNYNGIKLYRYGRNYTNLAGAAADFIGDDVFILVAPTARFTIEFGMIMDLDAEAAVVGEFFSKSWLEKDPSVLWMLAESRPLPVLWQPEAVVYADVIV